MTKLVRFDWAMKYLLRNKANFDILEGFLSELLKTSIKINSILESESNKNHAEDKYNRVDLLAETQQNERIIIEVQCTSQWDYFSRILYGTSKVVTEYISEGATYGSIRKVISVSVVFFNLGEGEDYLYKGTTIFRGIHCNDILKLAPAEQELYINNPVHSLIKSPEAIFPEYYIIKVSQFHERVANKLDEWIYFLKNSKIKQSFNAQGLQSAAKKLDILRLDEKERRAYESYKESLHDEASLAFEYQHLEEKAEAKGLAKGEAIGLEKGEAIGVAKGVMKIAGNMIKQGLSSKCISDATGLTREEINALSHQIQELPSYTD